MIERGLYVHYSGSIYFVDGISIDGDTHDPRELLVIYNAAQGGGGIRHRTLHNFEETVNPKTGERAGLEPEKDAEHPPVPRFRRVVGWTGSTPLVLDEVGQPMPYRRPV